MNQTTCFAIFFPAPSLTRRLQFFEGSSPLRSLCWHICDRTESPSAFCQLPISAPFQLQQREEAAFAPESSSKATSHLVLFFLCVLWWFDFFGFWIFCFAVMFYEIHRGWQLRLSPDIQEVCLHGNNWHGWNITAFKPVWGLSASVTSVCRVVQTHPFIHNQVISRPGRAPRPLPFFSSRRCRRQVGGQVCPLIQNDNLPPPSLLPGDTDLPDLTGQKRPRLSRAKGRGGARAQELRLGSGCRNASWNYLFMGEGASRLSRVAEKGIFSWGNRKTAVDSE